MTGAAIPLAGLLAVMLLAWLIVVVVLPKRRQWTLYRSIYLVPVARWMFSDEPDPPNQAADPARSPQRRPMAIGGYLGPELQALQSAESYDHGNPQHREALCVMAIVQSMGFVMMIIVILPILLRQVLS